MTRSEPTLTPAPPAPFLAAVKDALGPRGWTEDPDRIATKTADWRGRFHGHSPLLLLPDSTEETAAIVRLCAAHGVAITPQGGNTGLVDGGIPHGEVLLSLQRMTAVRDVDPLNNSMVVEAGLTLTGAQDTARAADRFFPLSLGSQGQATIGGLVSTNAGGVAVLRYGMMRDLILGLEVVLPSGEIWNGITGLRKNNTGYDLKHLFAGAEGTLGVITAANLKLFPAVRHATAWAALADPRNAVALLARLRAQAGDTVTGFEIMPANAIAMVREDMPTVRDPLPSQLDWRLLIEVSLSDETRAAETLEAAMSDALEAGLIEDVVLAQSGQQAADFWKIRESIPLSKRAFGAVIAHDISVPVSKVPEFLTRCRAGLAERFGPLEIVAFGHLGDGNLHYSVCAPKALGADALKPIKSAVTGFVHDLVCHYGGSISAEHGIGREKRDELAQRKSPAEISVMRAIKAALDPKGIMNPGRVVSV